MPDWMDKDEILARNPQIDRERLEKIGEMARQLRDKNPRQKGRETSPASGRRRISAQQEDGQTDPRAVRLRRSARSA